MRSPLALLSGLAVLLAFSPLLAHLPGRGSYDQDKELFDTSVAREAIVRFHELPVWNRYCGGGNPLVGNPETFCASPFFALVLCFGAPAGLKLSVILHALLGAWGMGRFVRAMGGTDEAAAFGAVAWPLTGTLAIHLAVGHLQWQAGFLIPWLFLPAVSEGARRRKDSCLAAGALGTMLLDGGVHVAIIGIVGSIAIASGEALRDRRGAPLLRWAAMLVLGCLLAGAKLVPSLSLLQAEPHQVASHRGYTPRLLIEALFTPANEPDRENAAVDRAEGGGYWEYGGYVGLLLLPLIVAGGAAPKGSERSSVFALGLVGLLLCLDLPFWGLLHLVPPFNSERRPSRFVILLAFALIVLSCRGLDLMRRWKAVPARVLALLVLLDTGLATSSLLGQMGKEPAPAASRQSSSFELRAGGSAYENFLEGRGTLPCRQGLHLPQAARGAGSTEYRGEAWLAAASEGGATLVETTSRTFIVKCDARSGDTIVLNQNDWGGWMVEGAQRASLNGLIAARLSGSGAQQVRFSVSTTSFRFGLALSLVGLVFLAVLARRGSEGTPGKMP